MREAKWWRPQALAATVLCAGCYSGLPTGAGDGETTDGASADAGDDGAADGGDDAADDGGPDEGGDDGVAPEIEGDDVPMQGLRRLSAAEYETTVRDILGIESLPARELLPIDSQTPFDNDYREQAVTDTLITSADVLATEATERLLENTALRDHVLGCTPTGADDSLCMRSFVAKIGRRALRRPLDDAEIDAYLLGVTGSDGALAHASSANDFFAGVDFVLRALLQEPEFIYRVEIGTPVEGQPGVFRLNDFEVATRLSYLIWGTTPDDELLDLAEADGLGTPSDVGDAASWMLEDPRALARVTRFHAMWMGYESLPHGPDLTAAMQQETSALVQRVIFDDQAAWQELFRAEETYVGDLLAEHYGLPLPGTTSPQWTSYADTGRRGLLSHGSFLSVGGQAGDTSPVDRGKAIRERLFCEVIPKPPPDAGVDVDNPPTGDANGFCKRDIYAMHAEAGCASCHDKMDPVGFGLEQYDQAGRFRTHQPDNPLTETDESTCEIDGQGELVPVGTFSGPAELAQVGLDSGKLSACFVQQLHRFSVGRGVIPQDAAEGEDTPPKMDGADQRLMNALIDELGDGDFRFDDAVISMVSDPTFGYRREDTN